MRLTTKSRYGARAIFDLAYHSSGVPVQIKDISQRQEIPQRYLEQIFHKLKEAIDPVFCVDQESDSTKKCSREDECVTRQVWKEAGEKITAYFDSVTVDDLCSQAKDMGIKKDMKHPYDYSI